MGFKLPKQSMVEGTSAHRSALKAAVEAFHSPAKMKEAPSKVMSPAKGKYEDALKKDSNLPDYIKKRKELKSKDPEGYKTSSEYAQIQNKINAAYGVNKRYDEGSSSTTPKTTPRVTKTVDKDINKSKTVTRKDGTVKRTVDKNVTVTDGDKTKTKTVKKFDKEGDLKKTKTITKGGGNRNVKVTDAEGNVTKDKTRKTIGSRLKNIFKKKDKNESPATMKTPGKMKKESMAKMKKDGAMKMKKESAMKMKKEGAMKMKKAPGKFNAKLKAASAAGKLSGEFKKAVDDAPSKMKKSRTLTKKLKDGVKKIKNVKNIDTRKGTKMKKENIRD